MNETYVDVYMLANETVEGNYQQAGSIYCVKEETAKELKREGKCREPYDYMLNHWIEKSVQYIKDFEQEKEAIKNNTRLTEPAKRDDLEALIAEYDNKYDVIQSIYEREIDTRLEAAKKEAGISALKTKTQFDSEKVRQEVGVIISDLVMINNFDEAISYIREKLESMHQELGREVVSQFFTIKTHLDELKQGNSVEKAMASTKVRGIYDDLKKVAADEKQIEVDSKVGLYAALKRNRSDISWEWRRKKQFMGVR
ncbi:TPA: hypothetical protein ROX98_000868 [Bacillus pseudomycoides]|nr:hypothetical protein [Bacillus pseudomycoides]